MDGRFAVTCAAPAKRPKWQVLRQSRLRTECAAIQARAAEGDGRQPGSAADFETQVRSEEFRLLTGVGNVYYDAQQYPVAVDYYGRALRINASDAAVRTDMATAYWYMGNADTAIEEFNKALTYAPTNREYPVQSRPGQVARQAR